MGVGWNFLSFSFLLFSLLTLHQDQHCQSWGCRATTVSVSRTKKRGPWGPKGVCYFFPSLLVTSHHKVSCVTAWGRGDNQNFDRNPPFLTWGLAKVAPGSHWWGENPGWETLRRGSPDSVNELVGDPYSPSSCTRMEQTQRSIIKALRS